MNWSVSNRIVCKEGERRRKKRGGGKESEREKDKKSGEIERIRQTFQTD